MNKTLIVLMLFIYGSMSGKVPLSKLSNNSVESVVISEAQLFFETISPEDRDSFILFYLAKGLHAKSFDIRLDSLCPSPTDPAFDNLIEPENFSLDLLEWAQEEFQLEDEDVARLLSDRVVCLDSGKCIYPRDVGSNCCLF